MTTTYPVPSTTTVTQQQVDDLLCAAFEGGISYWCDSAEVDGAGLPEGAKYKSDALTRGARIRLHISDDDEVVSLTLSKFLEGIARAAAHYRASVDDFLEDHDADSADAAVQYAVFGELVYG